jgi:hypothetical protein
MEMLDRLFYQFFAGVDKVIAKVESYVIRATEWCWSTRVKLLHKRRKINDSKRRINSNK